MTVYTPPADLYPFESNWLDVDGGKIHFLDEGPRDAPPVLMLHGNPTWSFYYRNLVLALRDRFRCIVPDHMGCGLSDKPGDDSYPYHLSRRVEDIESLYQHLGLNRPLSMVVHDWGGMIGFAWARNHLPEISRTVVLNTAAFPMPGNKKFPFALWLAGRTPLGSVLVRGVNAFSGVASRVAFKKPVSDQVRSAYTGPYNSWESRIATLRFVQDIPLKPEDRGYSIIAETEAALPGFAEKPALIAWGEKDFVFDEPFLQTWQRHFPAAHVQRYPDCGHYILEDAGEDLVERIAAFLDQHEQSA